MGNDSLSFPGERVMGPLGSLVLRGKRKRARGRVLGWSRGCACREELCFAGLEDCLTVSLFSRDIRSLGITMMGHQKKILSSIQAMRSQLLNTNGPRRHL